MNKLSINEFFSSTVAHAEKHRKNMHRISLERENLNGFFTGISYI